MGILNLDDVPPPFGTGEQPDDRPAPAAGEAGAGPSGLMPAPASGEPAIPPHVTGAAPPPQASPAAAPPPAGRPPVSPPRGLGEPVVPPHVEGSAPPQGSAMPAPAADGSSSSLFDTSALTEPDPGEPGGREPAGQPPAPGVPPAAPSIESDPVKTLELKPLIVEQLSTVFDPEIPVNIYELGLIYDVAVDGRGLAVIQMTLTAPGCPAAVTLPAEVQGKVKAIEGVSDARVDLVWEPPWDKDRMSDAAKLQLGIFD